MVVLCSTDLSVARVLTICIYIPLLLLPLESVLGTAWWQLHDCGSFSQKEGTQDIILHLIFLQLEGCWFVLMFRVPSYLCTLAPMGFQRHRQLCGRSSKQQRLGWTAAPCATGKSLQKGLPWSSTLHFLPMGRRLDPSSWCLVEKRRGKWRMEDGTILSTWVWSQRVKMWFFEWNLRPKVYQTLQYSLLM